MLKKSISLLLSFIILLSLILFNAIILLNSTFIFKLYMIKTNIPSTLSIPLNKILADYKNMISFKIRFTMDKHNLALYVCIY